MSLFADIRAAASGSGGGPPPRPPRVLAFADRRESLVAAARVHAPLRALLDIGLIADYVVTDGTLRAAPRHGAFDVVWLQRAADPWLAGLLATRLPGGYLLDVDDHLLCRPAYLDAAELPPRETMIAALRSCRTLTAPSSRLVGLLEHRSGVALTRHSCVCPNAVPFGDLSPRAPTRPAALLVAQSHALALTESRDEVLAAVAQAAARHSIPLWSLGARSSALDHAAQAAGAALHVLRPRTWGEYHHALAGPPTLLGIAPLETHGDAATLEFVSGKSDVKRVEFGGFGHPAVYSAAPPYTDSDLICGRVVPNQAAAWETAIDELLQGGWTAAAQEAHGVRELRDLRRVAVERWWPAVEAACLDTPVDAARLLTELDRARAFARERLARARWHLAARRTSSSDVGQTPR